MVLLPPTLLERVGGAARRLPRELVASLLVVLAYVTFTVMAVFVRSAAEHLPVIVIVFLRQVLTMLLMAPLFWMNRRQISHPMGFRLHALRGFTAVGAMLCGLTALVYVPFADVTAIQMTEALFVTALAALLLRETVGWRRWSATAVGFLGVVVMLQPFSGGIEHYALVALLGAVFSAFAVISLRLGSTLDSTVTVLFYQGLVVLALTGPLAWWYWEPVTLAALQVVFMMSLVMVVGQLLFTSALRMGEASALAPLGYLRLLMMGVVGYWLYAEVPSLATVLGALLVVGSASYTLHRNAKRQEAIAAAAESPSPEPERPA